MKRNAAALAGFLAASPLLAGATITIVNADATGLGLNDPTPAAPMGGNAGTTVGQQRLIALQAAAAIWGSLLDSPVAIRIRARFSALSCDNNTAVLAQTAPTQLLADFVPTTGFPGPELAHTWYPVALANRRAGADLLPQADDISVTINSSVGQQGCGFTWYYGLDGNHGAGVDLVTTMLHEYSHGFGFLTEVSSSGTEFASKPDIFETHILDNSTGKLWPEMTDAERLASSLNTGHVVWAGASVTDTVPSVLRGAPELTASAPAAGDYAIGLAEFGPAPTEDGVSGILVAALDPSDASGPSTFDACSPVTNASSLAGRIALIDRGTCTFVSKTLNVQAAGAIAAVIADNVDGPVAGMGGTDPTVTIPAVRVTRADGATLRAAIAGGVSVWIHLDPEHRTGADASGRMQLYAPNPYSAGSSISHWDTSAYPDLLMQPNIAFDLGHGVDLTLPALRDIGWYPDVPAREPATPVHRADTPKKVGPRPPD
jgi:hypothetical protein